jgi:hypothetical protein
MRPIMDNGGDMMTDMPDGCAACGAPRTDLIDFGPQPMCNRLVRASDSERYRVSLGLSRCNRCALLQLTRPWPASELRPRVDWIRYNEPERHLDAMSLIVRALPGVDEQSLVAGLSYKDDPMLNRLAALGLRCVWPINMRDDLGIGESGAGIETIQARLNVELAQALASRGRPDVLVARHVLEHCGSPQTAVAALKAWVEPGGYIVFEVPDSARAFTDYDYSAMWEEHALYFTENTLQSTMASVGLELVSFHRFPYSMEDCLAVIGRNQPPLPSAASPSAGNLHDELRRGEIYRDGLAPTASRWQRYLRNTRARGGKAVVFGAGHRAITFINLLGLGASLDCVVDDDPHKQGLRMPGSELPIVGSESLRDAATALCLLTLSPESEDRFFERHGAFAGRGGRVESIYPRTPRASPALLEPIS